MEFLQINSAILLKLPRSALGRREEQPPTDRGLFDVVPFMVDREESLGLPNQPRRFHASFPPEGQIRHNIDGLPLSVHRRLRDRADIIANDGNFLDLENTPHSDRVPAAWVTLPTEVLRVEEARGDIAEWDRMRFEDSWSIGADDPHRLEQRFGIASIPGLRPLPEDTRIMVGGQPLRIEHRSPFPDLSGPVNRRTPEIGVNTSSERAPEPSIFDLRAAARRVSAQSIHTAPSMEAYDNALLDRIDISRHHNPVTELDDFQFHWHRYPPRANFYIARSHEGNTPRRWSSRGLQQFRAAPHYPDDVRRANGGVLTPGHRRHAVVAHSASIVSIPRPLTPPDLRRHRALALGATAVPDLTHMVRSFRGVADWVMRLDDCVGAYFRTQSVTYLFADEVHERNTTAIMTDSILQRDYLRRHLPGPPRLTDLRRPRTVVFDAASTIALRGYHVLDPIAPIPFSPVPSLGSTRVERTMQKYMNTVIRFLMQQCQEPHPGYHFWDRAAEHALHSARLRAGAQAVGDDDLPIARHEIYVSALRIMLAAIRLRMGADAPSIIYTYIEFLELAQRSMFVDDPAPLSNYLPLTALTMRALDSRSFPSTPLTSSSSSSSSDSTEPPPAEIIPLEEMDIERDELRNLELEMIDDDDDEDGDSDDDETWLGGEWRNDLNANFISHYEHRQCREILSTRHSGLQVNSRFMDARCLVVLRRLEARNNIIQPGVAHLANMLPIYTDRSLPEFRSWLTGHGGFPWPHDVQVNCLLRLKATFTRYIAQTISAVRRAIWPAPPIHPSLMRVEGNWPGITWFLQDQLSVFVPASWNLMCLDCHGYDAFIFRSLYMRHRDPGHRSYMCMNCHSINVGPGGPQHEVRLVDPRFQSLPSDISQFHRALLVHSTKEGDAVSDSDDDSWCSSQESDDDPMHAHADETLLHTAAWKRATTFDSADALRARRSKQFTFYKNAHLDDNGYIRQHMKFHALRMQIYMLLYVGRHGQEPSLRACIDTLNAVGNAAQGNPNRFIQLVLPYLAPVIEGMFRCMHCLSLNGPTLPVVHHHWCPCRGTNLRGVPGIMGPDDYASTWWGVGITHLRQHIATIDARLDRMRALTRECTAYRDAESAAYRSLPVSPQQRAEHRAMLGGRSTFPIPPETFNIRDRHDAALIIGRIPSLGNSFIVAANDVMFDVHVTEQLAQHPARHDPRVISLVSFASSLTPPRLSGDRLAPVPRNILLTEAGHGMAPLDSSISGTSSELSDPPPHRFESAREAHAYAADIIRRYPERNFLFLADNLEYMLRGLPDVEARLDYFGGPWIRQFPVDVIDFHRRHDRALMHFSSLPSTYSNYVGALNGRHARQDARLRWEQLAQERLQRHILADTRPSVIDAAVMAGCLVTRDFRYWEQKLVAHIDFIKPSFGEEGVMLPYELLGQDLTRDDTAILFWDHYFKLDIPNRHMLIDDRVCIRHPVQLDGYGNDEDRPRVHQEDRFIGMALEPYPGYPPDMRCNDLANHPLRLGAPDRSRSILGFHVAPDLAPKGPWRERDDIRAFLRWIARMESLARTLLFLYNRFRRAILAEDDIDPALRDVAEQVWPSIKLPNLELPQIVGPSADMKHLHPRAHVWPDDYNHAFRDLGLFPGWPPIEWLGQQVLAPLDEAFARRGMRRSIDFISHAHMTDFWEYVQAHEKRHDVRQHNRYRDGTRIPRVPYRNVPHEFVRIAGYPQHYVEEDEDRIAMRGLETVQFRSMDLALPETSFRDCPRDRLGRPSRYSRNALRTLIGDDLQDAVDNLRSEWEIARNRLIPHNARPPLTFPVLAPQADPSPILPTLLTGNERRDRSHFRHMVRSIRVALGQAIPFPCSRRATDTLPGSAFRIMNQARMQWRRCLAYVMTSLHMPCFEIDWNPDWYRESSRFGEIGFPQILGRIRLFFAPADTPLNVDMIMHDVELGHSEPNVPFPPNASLYRSANRSPVTHAGARRRHHGDLELDIGPLDPAEHHFSSQNVDAIPNLCILCGRRIPDGRSWLICFQCDPHPPTAYARHRIIHLSEPMRPSATVHRARTGLRAHHEQHHRGYGGWALGGNGGGHGVFNGADLYRTSHEVPDFVADQAWAAVTHGGFIVRRGERFMG